jgi:histidine triad (HIT) family protein
MSEDCIFCKIAGKEIKSDLVYEDDEVVAFRDINPQAPVHIQIIPKRHIARVLEIESPEDQVLTGKLVSIAGQLAREEKISGSGYRLVFNCNRDAGQEVFHIHLHLLGGREMTWPPG